MSYRCFSRSNSAWRPLVVLGCGRAGGQGRGPGGGVGGVGRCGRADDVVAGGDGGGMAGQGGHAAGVGLLRRPDGAGVGQVGDQRPGRRPRRRPGRRRARRRPRPGAARRPRSPSSGRPVPGPGSRRWVPARSPRAPGRRRRPRARRRPAAARRPAGPASSSARGSRPASPLHASSRRHPSTWLRLNRSGDPLTGIGRHRSSVRASAMSISSGLTPTPAVSPDHDSGTRLLKNGSRLRRRPRSCSTSRSTVERLAASYLASRLASSTVVQVWRTSSSKLRPATSTVAIVAWARTPT